MQVTILVVGVPELVARLNRITLPALLEAPMQRAIELVRSKLREYPPERPGQTYVRTGDLGQGWADAPVSSSSSGFGLTDTLSNEAVEYAPFVQRDPQFGDPHQAWMHRDRWSTDAQILEASAQEIGRDFTAAIQAEL